MYLYSCEVDEVLKSAFSCAYSSFYTKIIVKCDSSKTKTSLVSGFLSFL